MIRFLEYKSTSIIHYFLLESILKTSARDQRKNGFIFGNKE